MKNNKNTEKPPINKIKDTKFALSSFKFKDLTSIAFPLAFRLWEYELRNVLKTTLRKVQMINTAYQISSSLRYEVVTDVEFACVNKAVKTSRAVRETIILSLKSSTSKKKVAIDINKIRKLVRKLFSK